MSFFAISNVFDDFFDHPRHAEFRGFRLGYPTIKRDDGDTKIELEVPGCSEEDISVEISGEFVYVKGIVRGEKMMRTYFLPAGCSPDDVTAKVENGLLTIELPVKKPKRKVL